jgi:hypothetical protein
MATEFRDRDCRFVFVYTREAHPSDRYPGHDSLERKLDHARAMAEKLGFERPMLVDDLEGTVHQAFGRLPNMTYIVNAAGTIVYRAAWTDPRTIRGALEQIVFERGERRAKRRITPYYMEWEPQRANDDVRFVQDLFELGGARPVDEFIAAMDDLEGPARTKRIKEWWAEAREKPSS